jgi:hypothetical protein
MTLVPLTIATACYIWAAVALAIDTKYALGFTYLAYAAANVGLMYIAAK